MLIDAHMHTSGISPCSHRTPAQIVAQCLADETDGFVLTNHCDKSYTRDISYSEWCRRYNEEYYSAKRIGDRYGVRVFFGIEVNTATVKNVHYLIYGITPQALLSSPELYLLEQQDLYAYCVENDFALFQAHPFRNGTVPQDPRYLHGVEINCHPIYKTSMSREVRSFAEQHQLKLSCGSDFHGDHYKPYCGMYLPEEIRTEKEFKNFITTRQAELKVMEVINVEE